MAFHADQSASRWVFGGNRTGKTECGAMEAVWWALGTHPHREIEGDTEGWVVSLSYAVGRDVAQAKVLKYLPPHLIVDVVMRSGKKDNPSAGVIDFIAVRNKFGGVSKIGFKSCDQGREKFQGTGLDWVWFDEEPPQDVYEECLLRTLDKGGVVWGTMTPLKGRTWLYERIYLGQGVTTSVHQMSWEDNPFLVKSEVSRMEKELSRDALESRKFGNFSEGEGMVFSELSDENVIDPIPIDEDWQVVCAIDPGYVHPTAAVFVARAGENYYVIDDYSVAGKQVEEHARALQPIIAEHNAAVVIDSAAGQRNLNGPNVILQFQQNGVDVRPVARSGVIEGLMGVKSLLCNSDGVRRLFVFRSCVHLLREMRMYYWGADERPTKRNDHCIDALRYALAEITKEQPRASPSCIERNKKLLIKRNKTWT